MDGGGLREIFRRAGDFPDVEIGVDDLRQHLVVEDEVVGVAHKCDFLQHLAGESAVAGVVFRQFLARHNVLETGQAAVEKVFVVRHPTLQRAVAEDARS